MYIPFIFYIRLLVSYGAQIKIKLIGLLSPHLFSCICVVQNYDAKISDFGLAKLGPSVGESHVTTRVMGTYGYAAPEYIATGDDISSKYETA